MTTPRLFLTLAAALCAVAISAATASAATVTVSSPGGVTEGSGGLGGTATFNVTITQANGEGAVNYSFATTSGQASEGADYTGAFGAGNILACATVGGCPTTFAVPVSITGDDLDEADENFGLKVTAGAVTGTGSATILDDDNPPALEVDGDKIAEGNTGQSDAKVQFELKAPSGRDVVVQWQTSDRSAFDGLDYSFRSGTVTFQPGQTEKSVHIPVFGDTSVEPDEQFAVDVVTVQHAILEDDGAKVTIVNDDVPPPPPPAAPADHGSPVQGGTPAPLIVTVPGTQQQSHQTALSQQSQALAPHAAADRTGPLMSLAWRGLNEERKVAIKVGCPASETRCRGTLVLRAGGHELARRSFALAGGESRTLRVRLSRRALRRVLRSGALVTRLTARDAAGNASLRTRTFVI